MRLREAIALRWEDVDLDKRIIAVSLAVEEAKGYRGVKAPKTERGGRTFKIDDGLAGLLAAHREKQQRLVAGLPDLVDADVSLIKLPAGALLFQAGTARTSQSSGTGGPSPAPSKRKCSSSASRPTCGGMI